MGRCFLGGGAVKAANTRCLVPLAADYAITVFREPVEADRAVDAYGLLQGRDITQADAKQASQAGEPSRRAKQVRQAETK